MSKPKTATELKDTDLNKVAGGLKTSQRVESFVDGPLTTAARKETGKDAEGFASEGGLGTTR